MTFVRKRLKVMEGFIRSNVNKTLHFIILQLTAGQIENNYCNKIII
jgi:hypothetical protein